MISYLYYFVPRTAGCTPDCAKGFISLLFYLIHSHNRPEKRVIIITFYRGRQWREILMMVSQLVNSKTGILDTGCLTQKPMIEM